MTARACAELHTVSLFSGIGGLDYAGSHGPHTWFCDSDPQARRVLYHRFGELRHIMTDVGLLAYLPDSTELVTAGFPCQDWSQAGRKAGKVGTRSGLVGEVFRLLDASECDSWVLIENVPNLLRLHAGAGIRYITDELSKRGYSWAYRTIDSRAFGATAAAQARLFARLTHTRSLRGALLG